MKGRDVLLPSTVLLQTVCSGQRESLPMTCALIRIGHRFTVVQAATQTYRKTNKAIGNTAYVGHLWQHEFCSFVVKSWCRLTAATTKANTQASRTCNLDSEEAANKRSVDDSPTRSRRAVTDPPPQALNKLNISQCAVCQPVLGRPVWPYRTLHIEHIQRTMTFECRPVQVTSLMAKQWGLSLGAKAGHTKQCQRAHSEWLVPSPSQKHCPHCQKTRHRSHACRCAHAPRTLPQEQDFTRRCGLKQ